MNNFFRKFTNQISTEIVFRFPSTYIFLSLVLLLALLNNHEIYFLEKPLQSKISLSFILLSLLSVSIHLFFEEKNIAILYKVLIFLVAFIAVYLSVFIYYNSIIFFCFAIIVLSGFSKFLSKKYSNETILSFNLNNITIAAFAAISSFILLLGIKMIFLSIEYLFEITLVTDIFFADLYLFISTIIFPTLVLSNILKSGEEKVYHTKVFLLLIKNILSPLVFVYTIVLYAYFIKITVVQELPKGNLASIVCVFLSIGLLVKSFLPGIKEHNFLSGLIDKYFIYFMIVPIIFLDIAIYIRIEQYGVTVLRYSLVLSSLWFMYLFFYELIKKEFSLKNALISLSILLLISSISPLNGRKISIDSQMQILKTIFIENDMIKNGKVVSSSKIDMKQSRRIISSILYIKNSLNGITEINSFLGTNFFRIDDIMAHLSIKYPLPHPKPNSKYDYDFDLGNIFINSKGYDFVIDSNFSSGIKKKKVYANKPFSYELKNNILKVYWENDQLDFDLESMVKKWEKQKIKKLDSTNFKNAILIKENKNIKCKIFVKYMTVFDSNNNVLITNIHGLMAIKIKK